MIPAIRNLIRNRAPRGEIHSADYSDYDECFDRIHAALKAGRYRITCRDDNPPAGKGPVTFVYGKTEAPPEDLTPQGTFRGFLFQDVKKWIPKFVEYDKTDRWGHYLAAREGERVHYLVVDDINCEERQALAAKYQPAVVTESSPGNFQYIIKIRAYMDNKEVAARAAMNIVQRLNFEFGDAKIDPDTKEKVGSNIKDESHAFRFPPFKQNKPSRRLPDGTAPRVRLVSAHDVFCPLAQSAYDKEVEKLLAVPVALRQPRAPKVKNADENAVPAVDMPAGMASCGISHSEWYFVTALEITISYQARKIQPPQGRDLDLAVGVRLRVCGYREAEVARVLAHAHEFKDFIRGGTVRPTTMEQEMAYGREQARCAFHSPTGNGMFDRLLPKAKNFLKRERASIKQLLKFKAEEENSLNESCSPS